MSPSPPPTGICTNPPRQTSCQVLARLSLTLLIFSTAASTAAVHAAESLTLYQSTFTLQPGQATQVPADSGTISFLNTAASRKLTVGNSTASSFVVSPSRDRSAVILGASLRTKPGSYNVTLSATSSAGEQRVTTFNVVVDALPTVPSSSTRPPVVLLNGWETGYSNSCPVATSSSETFGNLAQYLVSDGVPDVYLFDNCLEGPNDTIETLASDLGTFLNSITYDNGKQVPQIDLVAHSMGGLIARAYLAGLQPSETFSPPTTTLVRDLVMIAVPNFGSFVAGNYSVAIAAGNQSAEMIPGSSFLWNLATWNQRQDDLRGVNAIAIIGNAGQWLSSATAPTALNNASDGLVSLTSASLSFTLQGASLTRIVPYCHIDPFAYTNPDFGAFACNAPGIANVTSTSHPTGQIVRSFLGGATNWKSIGTTPATDPYLSADGGMYFALVSEQNQFLSDLSAVEWGTVAFTAGGDIGVVFYDDFIGGSGVLLATSASAGNVDCGTQPQPAGYFAVARCKFDADIFSIGPLVSGAAKIVNSGANITITGYMFGNSQCSGCQVQAIAAGATTATTLQISSWTNTSIVAALPSTFSGFVTISVLTAAGNDAMNIMTVPASSSGGGTPTLSVSPTSLTFSYTSGSAAPAAQTVIRSSELRLRHAQLDRLRFRLLGRPLVLFRNRRGFAFRHRQPRQSRRRLLFEHRHHNRFRSHRQPRRSHHLPLGDRLSARRSDHRRRQLRRLSTHLRLRHLARHLRLESLSNYGYLDLRQLRQRRVTHLPRRSLRHHRRRPCHRRIRQPHSNQRPGAR